MKNKYSVNLVYTDRDTSLSFVDSGESGLDLWLQMLFACFNL